MDSKPKGSDCKNSHIHADTELPELVEGEYLHALFYESGIASPGFNGLIGISWNDLKAWHEISGYGLKAWDIAALYKMSNAYAAQANSENYDAPYKPIEASLDVEEEPNTPEDRFRALLDQRVING